MQSAPRGEEQLRVLAETVTLAMLARDPDTTSRAALALATAHFPGRGVVLCEPGRAAESVGRYLTSRGISAHGCSDQCAFNGEPSRRVGRWKKGDMKVIASRGRLLSSYDSEPIEFIMFPKTPQSPEELVSELIRWAISGHPFVSLVRYSLVDGLDAGPCEDGIQMVLAIAEATTCRYVSIGNAIGATCAPCGDHCDRCLEISAEELVGLADRDRYMPDRSPVAPTRLPDDCAHDSGRAYTPVPGDRASVTLACPLCGLSDGRVVPRCAAARKNRQRCGGAAVPTLSTCRAHTPIDDLRAALGAPRYGEGWGEEECAWLRRLTAAGYSSSRIALRLGRTEESVELKWAQLEQAASRLAELATHYGVPAVHASESPPQ